MKTVEVFLSIILAACVVYIIWCIHGATRYIDEHPDDLPFPAPEPFDENLQENNSDHKE